MKEIIIDCKLYGDTVVLERTLIKYPNYKIFVKGSKVISDGHLLAIYRQYGVIEITIDHEKKEMHIDECKDVAVEGVILKMLWIEYLRNTI